LSIYGDMFQFLIGNVQQRKVYTMKQMDQGKGKVLIPHR
jgi:hypothetical protein